MVRAGPDGDGQAARLYQRILARAGNRSLAAAINEDARAAAALGPGMGVVLVPGLFYRSHPQTFGNGTFLKRSVRSLAERCHTVPLEGSEGPELAATRINEALRSAFPGDSLLLVSLSKGSAEVRCALSRPEAGEAFRRVKAWISISGLPFGTPAFDQAMAHPLRAAALRAYCRATGRKLSLVGELLRHRPGTRVALPAHLQLYQVVAFPTVRRVRGVLARLFQPDLSPYGPSDGYAPIEELLALPGYIYPLWGADHWLGGVRDLHERMARLIGIALGRTVPDQGRVSRMPVMRDDARWPAIGTASPGSPP